MPRKLSSLVALTVLAFAVGVYFTTHDDRDDRASAEPRAVEPPDEPVAARVDQVGEGEESREPVASVVDESPSSTATDAAADPTDPAALVSGSLVVYEGEALDQPSPSGRVRALEISTAGARWVTIDVELGRWSAELRPGAKLERTEIGVEGEERLAVGRKPSWTVPSGAKLGDELALEGRWVPQAVLRVIDADTKADLADVEIRVRTRWRAIGKDEIPGDHERVEPVLVGGVSPIKLPPLTVSHRTYWVRSPGYAWGRAFFGNGAGGEQIVELAHDGALRVRIVGTVPEDTYLRLRRLHAAPHHDGELKVSAPGETRIEGLHPGRYTVALEQGSFQSTTALGAVDVELLAGQVAYAEIVVDRSLLEGPLAPLAGTLRVPPEVSLAECGLSIAHLDADTDRKQETVYLRADDLVFDEAEPTLAHWRAGDVVPGDYLVLVTPVFHREPITVPEAGREDLEVVLPPAATAHVSFVDAASGAPLRPSDAQWMDGRLDGVHGNLSSDLAWAPTVGAYLVDTVAGPIEIRLGAAHGNAQFSLELEPGPNEVQLAVAPTAAVTIRFFEGDALLSEASDLLQAVRLQPDRSRSGTSGASFVTFALSEPGRYEVSVNKVPGFAAIEPRSIDVRLGETLEVRFDVERLDER